MTDLVLAAMKMATRGRTGTVTLHKRDMRRLLKRLEAAEKVCAVTDAFINWTVLQKTDLNQKLVDSVKEWRRLAGEDST